MMDNSTVTTTRREPGPDRPASRPWQRPDRPIDDEARPYVRRMRMMDELRARGSSRQFKLHHLCESRVDPGDRSMITYDSNRSLAARTALGIRSVELGLAEAQDGGTMVVLSLAALRRWLEAFGTAHGFRMPTYRTGAFKGEEVRARRFIVLLIELPPEARQRAKDCAFEAGAKRARKCASKAQPEGGVEAQRIALPPPIREFSPSESSPLNRQADESLDSGGAEKAPEMAPIPRPEPVPEPAPADLAVPSGGWRAFMLASLPDGDAKDKLIATAPARVVPASTIGPPAAATIAPPVESPRPEVQARPLADSLARFAPTILDPEATPSPRPGRPISSLVEGLPGSGPAVAERVARALLKHFREPGNDITKRTYIKYLDMVRSGELSADLVIGLIDDADRPTVKRPASVLSKSLAEEARRSRS